MRELIILNSCVVERFLYELNVSGCEGFIGSVAVLAPIRQIFPCEIEERIIPSYETDMT